jgi:hypothetical protein
MRTILAGVATCLALSSVGAGSSLVAQSHLTEAQARDAIKKLLEEQDSPLCGRGTGYCDMRDIILGGNVEQVRNPTPNLEERMIDPVTIQLSDYRLRVTRSEDRRHFQVSLTPDQRCGDAWFTDERKVVFVAKQDGCDQSISRN